MVDGGWTPSMDTNSRGDEDEDPLRQQIKNIKGFLEQVSYLDLNYLLRRASAKASGGSVLYIPKEI